MQKTINANKTLFVAVLVSYLCIVLPIENSNAFLGLVILFSPLGFPEFGDIINFIFGYLGVILTLWILISKEPLNKKRNNFVRYILLIYYIPLISFHWIATFTIHRYELLIYIIPEIIFIMLSIVLFIQTFGKVQKITSQGFE